MNIAVINIRDLVKVVLVLCLMVVVVVTGINIIRGKEELENEATLGKQSDSSFLLCLDLELPILANDEKEQDKELSSNNTTATTTTQKILDTQLAMLYNVDENTEKGEQVSEETVEKIAEESKEEEPQDKTIADSQNIETRVIEENNITPSFTDSNETIQVKNQSKYDINELIANANYQIKNKDKVVIYHTHTCESYTSSEKYSYEMTGAYRTTDLNYTVSRVGDELEECLKQYGKSVVHDKTYHDYPSYNGSYDRSLTTLKNILNTNPDAEIAIDLHRDAVRKYQYIWTECANRRR